MIFASNWWLVLAAIELVDPQDVILGHPLSLSNPNTGVRGGGDAVSSINGEGSSAVVHDGGVIVGGVQVVGFLPVEVGIA